MSSSLLLRALPNRRPRPDHMLPDGVDETDRPPGWRRRARRLFLGGPDEPRFARPLLWLLLTGTAALYLIDLTSSGYANEFYAAAVKSGTESLKAWLFGSLDAGNSITVDKPPASLWVMVLFARVFGFSSFSLLLPQALMGVGAVAALYATVKRWAGAYAGLVAGTLLALTPVAALMFRFDNPDAMLVLLMTLAAYAVVRAIDATGDAGVLRPTRGTTRSALRWMLVAGALIGVAFLTKMAQGLLVLPAFGLVYLVASPLRLRARIGHLLAATGAMVVAAGWYIALVELWPASARPYIGGSTDNSLWELALGYNGLGRLLGGTGNGGGGGGGFGGTAGVLRLFNSQFGTQISWLIPAALVALIAGLVATRRFRRTDKTRAALLLWGGWLVVTALVFSFMSGTVHPYYSVALAPAIAAVIAVGGRVLWLRRDSHLARATLAVMIAGTAVWGFVLMQRDASGWMTWLAWTMLIGGVLGALVLAFSAGRLKRLAVAGLVIGTLSALAGTASFTAATVASGHTGSTPTAGPAIVATSSGFGGGGQAGPGGGEAPTQDGTQTSGQTPTGQPPSGGQTQTTSTEVTDLLNATTTRWSAAVVGDQAAAPLILSSSTAVMAIGGWGGSDNSPTLAQFQAYVAAGDVTYFIASGNGGGGGGMGGQGGTDSSGSQITTWVEANFTSTTVGGQTVYDLTSPTT